MRQLSCRISARRGNLVGSINSGKDLSKGDCKDSADAQNIYSLSPFIEVFEKIRPSFWRLYSSSRVSGREEGD